MSDPESESDREAPARGDAPPKTVAGSDPKRELTEALDTLDGMLSRREANEFGELADEEDAADRQYTIPLLNDIVPEGTEPDVAPGPQRLFEPLPSLAGDEAFQRLVKRLGSEMEVIVQARVEEALGEATKSIRREVRRHMEIMLPEILEELADIAARKTGD